MLHLKSIKLKAIPAGSANSFPFTIPAVKDLGELLFTEPVTFLVGENGSGKSTLLEAIAYAAGAITVGSEHVARDQTLAPVRALADSLVLSWQMRRRKGFFLRAEDFFGYVKKLAQMRAELESDLQRIDEEFKGRSATAVGLAKMPYHRELHALQQQYGRDLSTYSHGESFLELFQARFMPDSLYLLDEPEAPLSPLRQLTFIALLKTMVGQKAQFIIATHSPILMAFPGAAILTFDKTPLQLIPYEALEHVVITRSFLNDPEQYLRHL
jgi:predicted ATPase